MKLMIGKILRVGEQVKIRSDLKSGYYILNTGVHTETLENGDYTIIVEKRNVSLAGRTFKIAEVFNEGSRGYYCKLDGVHDYWHGCLFVNYETASCEKCGKEMCATCGMCLHCLSKSYIEKLNEFYLSAREICKEHPMMTDKINRLWQGFMKQKRSAKTFGEKYSLEEFPEKFFEMR